MDEEQSDECCFIEYQLEGQFVLGSINAHCTRKLIDDCNRIAKKEGVQQRQTYTRESKELLRTTYNSKHPKRAKAAKAAMRHLYAI